MVSKIQVSSTLANIIRTENAESTEMKKLVFVFFSVNSLAPCDTNIIRGRYHRGFCSVKSSDFTGLYAKFLTYSFCTISKFLVTDSPFSSTTVKVCFPGEGLTATW